MEFSLTLESDQGKARVKIESVTIEGVNLPLILVNFMVNRYLDKQYDLNLDDPMPLPFRDSESHGRVRTPRVGARLGRLGSGNTIVLPDAKDLPTCLAPARPRRGHIDRRSVYDIMSQEIRGW